MRSMQIVARIKKIAIILLLDLLLGTNGQEKENNPDNLLLRNVPIRELIHKCRIMGIWSKQLEWERFQASKKSMILRVLRTLWDDDYDYDYDDDWLFVLGNLAQKQTISLI